jgi:serine/threonine protein kinase
MGWSEFAKIKKIGEGSFGKAWLVKSNKENKNFVIKEINISKVRYYIDMFKKMNLLIYSSRCL